MKLAYDLNRNSAKGENIYKYCMKMSAHTAGRRLPEAHAFALE